MTSDFERQQCRRKVRFGSDASARAALKKINPKRVLKKPSRVYKCPVCSGYHLTSSRK